MGTGEAGLQLQHERCSQQQRSSPRRPLYRRVHKQLSVRQLQRRRRRCLKTDVGIIAIVPFKNTQRSRGKRHRLRYRRQKSLLSLWVGGVSTQIPAGVSSSSFLPACISRSLININCCLEGQKEHVFYAGGDKAHKTVTPEEQYVQSPLLLLLRLPTRFLLLHLLSTHLGVLVFGGQKGTQTGLEQLNSGLMFLSSYFSLLSRFRPQRVELLSSDCQLTEPRMHPKCIRA